MGRLKYKFVDIADITSVGRKAVTNARTDNMAEIADRSEGRQIRPSWQKDSEQTDWKAEIYVRRSRSRN